MNLRLLVTFLSLTLVCVADELSWSEDLRKMDADVTYLAPKQSHSMINWKEVHHEKWLDFQEWKKQRLFKDKNPLWKLKLRERQVRERMAIVLKCVGDCRLYMSTKSSSASYLTSIHEGDEFVTEKDSYAWLILGNGALVRFSPKTSVSFNEINFSRESSFVNLRLNNGHVYYQRRENGTFSSLNLPQTDSLFYPVQLLEANREFFSRQEYKKIQKKNRPLYEAVLNPGFYSQYNKLNSMLLSSNKFIDNLRHEVLINTPNLNLNGHGVNFDLFYELGYKASFRVTKKIFNFSPEKELKSRFSISLRDESSSDFEYDKTYHVLPKGEEALEGRTGEFKFSQVFSKRIPTIHLARELLLRQKFPFLFLDRVSQKALVTKYSYRLWSSKEMSDRYHYLTRMIHSREKKNLERIFRIIAEKNEVGLDKSFYDKAVSHQAFYDKHIKSSKKVRDLKQSDLEYYVWVLRNGQF